MYPFNVYPYSDSHELNYDWLIKTVKSLSIEQRNFIKNNVIKFANPITWDASKSYQANTIVKDGDFTFLSTQAVPVNTAITDTTYWIKVGDMSADISQLRQQIATADEGSSSTASAARAVGEYVWINGYLYEVTAAINPGDTYQIGINIQAITIETLIDALETAIDAINNKFPVNTSDIADNAVTEAKINNNSVTRSKIGQNITIMLADSYGYHPSVDEGWVAGVASNLGLASTSDISTAGTGSHKINDYLYTSIYGSRGFITTSNQVSAPYNFNDMLLEVYGIFDGDVDNVDRIIVCGGTNDAAYYGVDTTDIAGAIQTFITTAKNRFPNAEVYLGAIGNIIDPNYEDHYFEMNVAYNSAVNCHVLHGVDMIMKYHPYLEADGQHPTALGSERLIKAITEALLTGSCSFEISTATSTITLTDSASHTMTIDFYMSANEKITYIEFGKFNPTVYGTPFEGEFSNMILRRKVIVGAVANKPTTVIPWIQVLTGDTRYKSKLQMQQFASSNISGGVSLTAANTSVSFPSNIWH